MPLGQQNFVEGFGSSRASAFDVSASDLDHSDANMFAARSGLNGMLKDLERNPMIYQGPEFGEWQ